jgi:hypothetical protein
MGSKMTDPIDRSGSRWNISASPRVFTKLRVAMCNGRERRAPTVIEFQSGNFLGSVSQGGWRIFELVDSARRGC